MIGTFDDIDLPLCGRKKHPRLQAMLDYMIYQVAPYI